jgi:protein O-mannosyl-transferase
MQEKEFSLRKLFIPLTSSKAIHILIIVGLVVFFSSLFNPFAYDDDLQIISNPLVHSLANIHYFFTGGNFFDAGTGQIVGIYYKPILSTVFTLLYAISWQQPFIFHFFQMLLHIVNACLVHILFRKFFKVLLSLFLSLIFLVHPINQESVVYISNLQENLFFFFGLLAFLISISVINNTRKIILVNIFLLLGLFSKETTILFVPILLLYSYIWGRKFFTRVYFFSILFTTVFYLYLHYFVAHLAKITDALVPIMKASLPERITTMPAIIFYYLKTFFFPIQLALGHSWVVTTLNFSRFYLPLFIDLFFFAILFFLGLYLRKINRKFFLTYLFFVCWLVLGIFMHLQIVPLDVTVAERWFYFPIVGMLGILGTIFNLGSYKKIRKEMIIITGIIIIALLAGRTMVRNTNWINTLTLCQHDLQIIPESYSVQSVCAGELLKAGRYEEAKKYYAKAAELAPKWGSNWYQYGLSYEYTKNIEKAQEYYRKSIQLSNEVNAYVSLASTYLKYEDNPQEAKKIAEKGLKSYPNYQRLQLYLAVCEYRLGNKQKALEIATKAHQISPTSESQYVLMQIMNNQEVKLQ